MAKLKVIGRAELSECRGDQRDVTTSPYTMTKEDYIVVAQEGDWQVKLPLAATCKGYGFHVKMVGASMLELRSQTVPGDDVPENIDGGSYVVMSFAEGDSYHVYSDGTEWFFLGSYS